MYSDPEGFMSCQNLVRFLYEVQQEEDAVVAAPALIQKYEPNERGRLKTLVCFKILLFLMKYELHCCCFFFLLSCVLFSPYRSPRETLTALGEEGRGKAGKSLSSIWFWVHWTAREGLMQVGLEDDENPEGKTQVGYSDAKTSCGFSRLRM